MSPSEIVVEGTLNPDGTLALDKRPDLPPGRVTVRLQTLTAPPKDDPFFEMLKSIWAARAQAKLKPRSVEEVNASLRQMDEASEEEITEAALLQEESRRLRNSASSAGGQG